MLKRLLPPVLLSLLLALLCLPVLAVFASWLQIDRPGWGLLAEMAATVLPDYALTTLALCLAVALGVTLLGSLTACAVTLFDFPGRRTFEWALLLPLAMPAYVVAFAYTDFLQFSGPLQSTLRELTGWQGRLLPDVQSLWGAMLVFTVALYPYV
jgi:iron(III) transport system permease protein